ncbi:class I adenylate-forming enzyme family protein [Nocardioides sp. GXZ039]|uniref:class I adenylate-forming enzyme family protein n=1 Tax=Nocardioides sp. GXZ039 TaxID=3136018 RepID=UPI0030F4266C
MRVLAEEFATRTAADPDHVAVIDADGAHRAADVWSAAEALSATIADVVEGAPTVLVQADNSWRTLVTALAVGRLDGFLVVFSGHATAHEFDLALEDVGPDVVIASPHCLETWDAASKGFQAEASALDGWTLRATGGATRGTERWRGGAAVAMTSGSTGRPKCVVQSESAIRFAAGATIDAVGLEPGDRVGAFVPLSSVAALCFGLYLPAMLGGTMVCLPKWNPADALDLIGREQVRWTMLVPTMALQFAMVDGAEGGLSSLKAMTVGGGPMDAGALGRAEDLLGTRFLRVFGMSECLGHTTPSPSDPAEIRLDRDGRPFPGIEVRVVDEHDHPLPTGAVGRAQVKGPSLFTGYARDGAPVPPELTPDGFFFTGDLARVNEDGTINIVGREKQIIIRGGRNIDINEVEAAVASVPDVVQVCVVPVPDEMLGERAAALVVTRSPSLDLETVKSHLAASGVPKHHWPEFVFPVADLPQNRVGKLARNDAVSLAARLAKSAERS